MDQAALHHLPVPFVELLPPELVIRHLLCQQRIDHDEQGVRYRHRGALGSSTRRQPSVLRGEVGVFGACCCLSGFDQGGAQPGTAFARASTAAFAGTLIVPWTQPGPGGKVAGTGKAGQIRADLERRALRRCGGPPLGWSARVPARAQKGAVGLRSQR
jgi:hypothetical protein